MNVSREARGLGGPSAPVGDPPLGAAGLVSRSRTPVPPTVRRPRDIRGRRRHPGQREASGKGRLNRRSARPRTVEGQQEVRPGPHTRRTSGAKRRSRTGSSGTPAVGKTCGGTAADAACDLPLCRNAVTTSDPPSADSSTSASDSAIAVSLRLKKMKQNWTTRAASISSSVAAAAPARNTSKATVAGR